LDKEPEWVEVSGILSQNSKAIRLTRVPSCCCPDAVRRMMTHQSPDTYKAIQEIRRSLKGGSLTLIMIYTRRSLNYFVHKVLNCAFDGRRKDPCPVEHTYTKPEITDMFKGCSSCKISVEALFGTGYGTVNMITPRSYTVFSEKESALI
jgi:hypothetical protein